MIKGETVLNNFLARVAVQPGSLALKFRDVELSYKQLDHISDQVANRLIASGVKPGTLVPVCLSRPLDMVIGIWGILKTGGAYVPIDPEFPLDRIKYMIADTGAEIVISDTLSRTFINAAEGRMIILADDNWAEIKDSPATAPGVTVPDDAVAYVIYTSGSTGLPKGVLIEHRSIIDYLGGLFNRLPYHTFRSFALGVSFAADSVITNLFGSLTLGAELHLFAKEDFNNIEYIHGYFNTHGIDCLKIVPSHWKSLSLNGAELLPQKLLMFGGEALYTAMIRDIIPAGARTCILVNHYGPTETTVGQLLHQIEDTIDYGHIIPIGKPFTDATIHIVDETIAEVESGQTGELLIGGTCVARGYLNRPELTAQRFIPNKFNANADARLYRTGDLVRQLPNGDVEYLERIDDQVKIRGYRIELGEIENVLQKAPGVKQGVVLAKAGNNGDKRLIAYVVCPDDYDKKAILNFLEEKLPAYMVPQLLVPLDALPFFPNGKVDKKALPNPDASTLLVNEYKAPGNQLEELITALWKELLDVARVGTGDNFFELGGNSLLGLKFIALLKTRHHLILPVAKIYQYPKIKDLAAFLDGKKTVTQTRKSVKPANADVAVIAMSGRFPGAETIAELWGNLKAGKETISFFGDDELDSSVSASLRSNTDYVKARGVLKDVKGFDAAFFGITPTSAELMDPQQRVFLEIAWEALEGAGYAATDQQNTIGVFAGVRFNTYYANNVASNTELIEKVGTFQVLTLNDKDYVASRTAYALDLKGPAINVQSACSTSLLAVAQAVQAIRNGQCDLALAGGATINAPVNVGHLYEEGAILSNDGHCRPFDAGAKGTVFSDGAGVVLLKNKEQAIKDGDTIIAVIKGVGLSNDGGGKGSFTAPSAEGQAMAIGMAMDDAGVSASDISYIEAHGTATPLGDPIEIEGLNLAFGQQERRQYCAIGSVKSNFGHLTATSGIAGLIKTCLALHHKQIPPSINYETANPHIDFEASPFFVNTELRDWKPDSALIAGISSFGVGGTNVHLVLSGHESAAISTTKSRPVQLLRWSAKSAPSLDAFGDQLAGYLKDKDAIAIADTAFTLHTARTDFKYRRFVTLGGSEDFMESQAEATRQKINTAHHQHKTTSVVFMFPGQGSQYLNMGKGLYNSEPVFRQAMDECARILKPLLKISILDVIYPANADEEAEVKLKNTVYSQPALFAIGYALGKLYMSWGIYPAAFIGHSIGEFVSACFAGVFGLDDGLKLIATRGKLMGDVAPGSMLSIRATVEQIRPYLSAEISLAAANSPQLCVLAGPTDVIAALGYELNNKGILNRLLPTSHAFHSYMMDGVVAPFEEVVKTVSLHPPLIPVVSTVTGEWLSGEEATSPSYWAKHLRATVFFGKAAQKLLDEEHQLFLELGPGNSTATLARQQAGGKAVVTITTLDKGETEQSCHTAMKALGQLWLHGAEPDWTAFYKDETRRRLTDLPAYAFNKQNYWVEPVRQQVITGPKIEYAVPEYPLYQQQEPVPTIMRKQDLIEQLKQTLENASGMEMTEVTPDMGFFEMGLDSLILTQVALLLRKQFALPITFRQLNEELGSLDLLAEYLDQTLPPETQQVLAPVQNMPVRSFSHNTPANADVLAMVSQQLQQLAMQVAQLQSGQAQNSITPVYANTQRVQVPATKAPVVSADLSAEEAIEIKKPFGAIARIEKQSASLNNEQQKYLAELTSRYNAKTQSSKSYTQEHRARMADPRVVSGFKPATKELVYSIVIKKSKGSRLWDIDDNEYIDALNGFGSNMLGYQPDIIKNALISQIEKGYEIGPQHELAGEVCDLICDFTGFDRTALCNTGSEAVIGAMRIARTVTGRSIIVAFAGSYHGITDEVIARGSKKLKTYPAAPGIMPEAVQNMLILDYGTDESLKIIEERAHEIAAVLVEPVQSRRADFQPIEFLKKLRTLTLETETILIFDEVISGFRFHPGGVQAMFGIKADLATYGKVAGGGLSIGIIAGHKQYMDALDGGFWQFGDNSVPEAGVTYFAGTFVRHPLALAAAKASLNYLKEMGPQLQEGLNNRAQQIANTINAMCRRLKVPMFIAQFGSLWRIRFLEEYPYQELFFVLMRYKGIHILEGFPCFLTTSHSNFDIDKIITCFEESLTELQYVGLIPAYEHPEVEGYQMLNQPPVAYAKLGKDKDGNPAWFVKDEQNPGKYLMVTN